MDTREDIVRISIENAQSWQRLETSCRHAVLHRLGDEITRRALADESAGLQAHVLQFIAQTLASAQPNLRVNGQLYGNLDDSQYEPFDEALDRRIWSLADTRMQWFKRIAETRRKLPQELTTDLVIMTQENQAFDINFGADTQVPDSDLLDTGLQKDNYHTIIQQLTALGDELDQVREQPNIAITYLCLQLLPEQRHRVERTKAVAVDMKAYKL
ncbi:hypothetical protein AX15_006128 [Amanita polypyramis BW_CC]|nr:hypothetical protein AX15_006128 [Amanita polypyramis BW_CC]